MLLSRQNCRNVNSNVSGNVCDDAIDFRFYGFIKSIKFKRYWEQKIFLQMKN